MNARMKIFCYLTIIGIFCSVFSSPAEAVVKPGVRAGIYTDPTDFFIGGEVLASLTDEWFFNPNLEYIFVENGTFVTINVDVHYDLPTRSDIYFWVGGGLAILYRDPEGRIKSNTDAGANLFMGVGFKTDGPLVPYIQPKIVLADNSEFSLAFGLRF